MNTKLGAFIIAIFTVIAILNTIRIFRDDKIPTRLFIMWLVIWFSIGFFALFPSMLDGFMEAVNMGDRLFFFTVMGILLLFILIFHISSSLAQIRRQLFQLAQEIAILKYDFSEKKGEINDK